MTGSAPEALLAALRDDAFTARATAWERAGAVPRAAIDELAALGLLGLTVDTAHRGSGTPPAAVTDVHRLVAAASPSLHSLLVVHAMVCHAVRRWASAELRDALLPELATGRMLAAFALTEQQAGADTGALTTTIERDGDTLRITGTKRWLSFGQIADAYLVFGSTDGRGSCALVDAGAGVRVAVEPVTAGLRAARLARVTFDGATAPAARAVDAHGGTTLGDRQLVRGLLADAALATDAAARYVRHTAHEIEDREPSAAVTAARAKLLASRAATTATATASRLLGAAGQTEDHPLARLHAAARVHEVIEGPTEVLQDIIAADLLRGRHSSTDRAPSPAAPYREEDDHRAEH